MEELKSQTDIIFPIRASMNVVLALTKDPLIWIKDPALHTKLSVELSNKT